MKVYNKQNVYEAALDRIRFIYDEFDNVVVAFSGGKDSTVILELTLIVARERNRLPVPVYFIDQESELQSTIDYCERVFKREEVKPFWFQIPFKHFNSSSFFDEWLYVWDEKAKDKWMREKSPISYKENIFGTDRFKELFTKINRWFGEENGSTAVINGMKADESMMRKKFLTTHPAYKDCCWSAAEKEDKDKKIIRFSPLYDWKVEDIWVAIGKNGWDYNPYYDKVYQLGGQLSKMRVSSVIHETSAEHHLMMLQQIEPETYDKLTKRLGGISTYSKLLEDVRVKEIPSMFGSWEEYTLYLINNVIKESQREKYMKMIESMKQLTDKIPSAKEVLYRNLCPIVLANDFEGAKFENLREKLKMIYKYDIK